MSYVFWNPNPLGKLTSGDCTVRAISKAMGWSWDKTYAALAILKDIGSVEMFEEGIEVQDDEYSFGYSMSNGMMNNGGYSQRRVPIYYNRGNSYRSRGYNDMGGSYSRRGRNGYSREDGKQHMVHKLEELMNEAQNDEDREAINRLIDQMENN